MDISASNTFTPSTLIQAQDSFDISISGTFVATVVVQRSKDDATWLDVETFTTPAEKTGVAGSAWYFRVGIKAGAYTSGTATVSIHR